MIKLRSEPLGDTTRPLHRRLLTVAITAGTIALAATAVLMLVFGPVTAEASGLYSTGQHSHLRPALALVNETAPPASDTSPSSDTVGDDETTDSPASEVDPADTEPADTDPTDTEPADTEPAATTGSPEPEPPAPAPGEARSVPLSAADRDLLVRVRQAGLWEIPTGQQAQQRAASQRVKEVGAHLVRDHTKLDEDVRRVADQLGVVLPSVASDQQQVWMNELSGLSGTAYDQAFADRLRAAHGAVFSVVAQVRAGTRHPLIRAFAQQAVIVVMRHMTLLESTGLVDYAALPEPQLSPAAATTRADGLGVPAGRTVLIVAMLAAAALIGTVSIRRVRRGQ